MKIYKPTWVSHSNAKHSLAIYSIHINPVTDRIATGAQGINHLTDFKIKIWSLESVKTFENDDCLSVLEMHDGAVLCVRWSFCGKYLASGADDNKIIIWELDQNRYD